MTANLSPATNVAASTIRLGAGWSRLSAWTITGISRAMGTPAAIVSGTSAHQSARHPSATVKTPPSAAVKAKRVTVTREPVGAPFLIRRFCGPAAPRQTQCRWQDTCHRWTAPDDLQDTWRSTSRPVPPYPTIGFVTLGGYRADGGRPGGLRRYMLARRNRLASHRLSSAARVSVLWLMDAVDELDRRRPFTPPS